MSAAELPVPVVVVGAEPQLAGLEVLEVLLLLAALDRDAELQAVRAGSLVSLSLNCSASLCAYMSFAFAHRLPTWPLPPQPWSRSVGRYGLVCRPGRCR